MRKLAWSCQSQPGLDPYLLEGQVPDRAAEGMKGLARGQVACVCAQGAFNNCAHSHYIGWRGSFPPPSASRGFSRAALWLYPWSAALPASPLCEPPPPA